MILSKEKELIKDGLKDLKSNFKNFGELLKSPSPFCPEFLLRTTKSDMNAQIFRTEGNELFKHRSCDIWVNYKIIGKYNASIGASPLNSESLAVAYGNRSAILEHIGKFNESISAINRALRITKSSFLIIKLLCRKAKCTAALGLSDGSKYVYQAKLCLEEMRKGVDIEQTLTDLIKKTEILIKETVQHLIKADDQFDEVSELISRVAVHSECVVKIAYSDKHGRHLIAAKDIKPGEILIVENTFNSNPWPDQMVLYCWHCNSFLWDIIPCDHCTLCCYCSEKCKTESWRKYHEMECKILPTFMIHHIHLRSSCAAYWNFDTVLYNQLGFRIFMTALKEAGNVDNLRTSLESFNLQPIGEEKIEDISSDDYRQVYALSSEVGKSYLSIIMMDSVIHLIVLARFTSLFKKTLDPLDVSLEKLISNDDTLLMGALLLKFCAVSRAHALKNGRVPKEKMASLKDHPCGGVGWGLVSWSVGVKTSLTLESCIPNSCRCMVGGNQVILYSIMPIKKGTPIFDSVTNIFEDNHKIVRQATYRQHRGFSCKCLACKEDWPSINYEGYQEYHAKIAPTIYELSPKIFHELESIWLVKDDLSTAEIMSKFSKLIQDSLKESPLPSSSSAITIKSFIDLVQSTLGYYSKPPIIEGC